MILHTRCVTGVGGGPDKTILNSPRFLRRWGYECVCAYMHPPGDESFQALLTRAKQSGAPLVSIPDYGPMDMNVIRRLIQVCRDHRVTIWHGHDYKSNALGLVVRWFWPMKLVTTVHGWVQNTWRTPVYYAIDKFCLKHYDEIVCVSKDLHDECLQLGVPAARCHWIHNAIDTDDYSRLHSRAVARKHFGEKTAAQIIGAMGRLSDEKGFDLLIRAVAELLKEGRDLCLWIAGEGGNRAKLESLIARLGCQDRIRLIGHVADTRAFFESLDIFALSSLREGLPNVLLEAMALEVPVLATRIAGIPRLIQDGHNGVLVEVGEVSPLVAGLRCLMDNPDLCHRLSGAGRKTIEESFSFKHRMQRIVGIYDALLARHSASAATAGLEA